MILKLNEINQAKGIVIVIDVLRAFSTSAEILNKVDELYIVSNQYAALEVKCREVLLVGEKGGKRIKGFDYDNSPYEMKNLDFKAYKHIILRSSSGTKAAMKVSKFSNVTDIYVSGISTAENLRSRLKDKDICCIVSGSRTPDGGDEDLALSEYFMGDCTMDQVIERTISCYSSKNWVRNKMDIQTSISSKFNFSQKIKKNCKNSLIVYKEV